MISYLVGFVAILVILYFFYGKKYLADFKKKRIDDFEYGQIKAFFNSSYQSERIKIAGELGKKKARDEQEGQKLVVDVEKPKNKTPKRFKTDKKPVCAEHNFMGKNWLDYARHIKTFHK